MRLRRDDVCRACGTAIPKGTDAFWDAEERTVTCASCLRREDSARSTGLRRRRDSPAALDRRRGRRSQPDYRREPDRGRPGASAEREYNRRRRNRETSVRRRHPHIGGFLLALCRTPQHERAYRQGADGERSAAAFLARQTASAGVVMLDDRRMPQSHANIDHIAVAPSGVYVIDSKNVSGKVRVTRSLRGKSRLRVGGRDCSKYLDGLDRQTAAVRSTLAALGFADVRVQGVLCFGPKADLPLLASSEVAGHRLHYRRALARRLRRSGPLQRAQIAELAGALAAAFPPA